DFVDEDKLLREVDRLRRITCGVARDEFDLLAVDAARLVDLVHRELHPLVLSDGRGRKRTGQRRQPAKLEGGLRSARRGERYSENGERKTGSRPCNGTLVGHRDLLRYVIFVRRTSCVAEFALVKMMFYEVE